MTSRASTPIGILTGPTATGKSAIAVKWAKKSGQVEIINADSLLVYRHFNIGTAKPSPQEMSEVPHHLIDICEPQEVFTAGDFRRAAEAKIEEILGRGKIPLIVGGTGFYLQALLFGTWDVPAGDPKIRTQLDQLENSVLFTQLREKDREAAERIGPSDRYRLIRALELFELTGRTPTEIQASTRKTADPRFRLWIIDRDSAELQKRIHLRTQQMLQHGWLDEVQSLCSRFPSSRPLESVGYAQVMAYLSGRKPQGRLTREGLAGLADEIELATRQLVKKQRTWFKNQTKKVPGARWFHLEKDAPVLEETWIKEILWNLSARSPEES